MKLIILTHPSRANISPSSQHGVTGGRHRAIYYTTSVAWPDFKRQAEPGVVGTESRHILPQLSIPRFFVCSLCTAWLYTLL